MFGAVICWILLTGLCMHHQVETNIENFATVSLHRQDWLVACRVARFVPGHPVLVAHPSLGPAPPRLRIKMWRP